LPFTILRDLKIILICESLCKKNATQLGIRGSLLLATEGINGTIAGTSERIEKILCYIKNMPGCADLEYKTSVSKLPPFPRMKVKLKKEIVTMGQPNIDPKARVGHYIDPSDWNTLVNDPNVVVIDTRNEYEVDIGTFKGAINPHTSSFREFPTWWEKNKEKFKISVSRCFVPEGFAAKNQQIILLVKVLRMFLI
jgi:UPF0176 protein